MTSKLGVFNIFKTNKINVKCNLQKRNFKVLFFKSQRISKHTNFYCCVIIVTDLGHPWIKTGWAKRSQFYIQHFYWLKVQKSFNLLSCILLDYAAHEITKRILKNINFENMTAVFLLVCQNWPRCEISLICCWNNDSRKHKMTLGYVMVSKNDQNIV